MPRKWSASELFATCIEADSLRKQLEPWTQEVICEISGLDVGHLQSQRLASFWLLHLIHRVLGIDLESDSHMVSSGSTMTLEVPLSQQDHMRRSYLDADYRARSSHVIAAVLGGSVDLGEVLLIRDDSRPRRPLHDVRVQISHGVSKIGVLQRAPVWSIDPYLKLTRSQLSVAKLSSSRRVFWMSSSLEFPRTEVELLTSQRLGLASSIEITDRLSALQALIPLMIPFGYAEGLLQERRFLQKMSKVTPKILYTANGLQGNLQFQVAAGLWSDSGTLVCTHQHGGHTGLDERHALEDLEAELSDNYYTFGWRDTRANVHPLPIPRPQMVRNSGSSRILVMSLEYSPFTYRLQPFCVPDHVERCLSETRQFIKDVRSKATLVVRCSERVRAEIGPPAAGVEFEELKGSGPKSASRSSLVVHNYLGTSWLETLAMNVPTVCFIPPGIHRFRTAAQPFADALQKVGILHYSGREAAKFVNGFNGDPSAWWN